MCGIVGIVDFDNPIIDAEKRVQNGLRKIVHRGPDGKGTFISERKHVAFGHCLLSIVDVGHNAQPLTLDIQGKKYTITFNGEIYNHRTLREEVSALGYVFRTKTDTEVLLASFAIFHAACLNKFNGDFSFAIYDHSADEIFFARDRVGVKPFYYTLIGKNIFAFASEPKAILGLSIISAKPNVSAIAEYYMGSFILTNGNEGLDQSFFESIKSLPAGHFGILNTRGLSINKYWDIPIRARSKDASSQLAARLKDTLDRAIDIRIPDEVNFATTLSGGLDSSIVTDRVHSQFKNIPAFSIRFSEGSNEDFYYSQKLANDLGYRLIAPELTPSDIMDEVDSLVIALDGPHDTIRQLGLYCIYKNMGGDKVKVALIGEGSDEFNLGYYHTHPGFGGGSDVPKSEQDFFSRWLDRSQIALRYFHPAVARNIDVEGIARKNVSEYYANCPTDDPIDRMQYYYCKKFLKYRLDANDRLAMANSVEARVPFCDYLFVDAALSVPHEDNLLNGTEKAVLRRAYNNLPPYIKERRKYGLPEHDSVNVQHLMLERFKTEINNSSDAWDLFNKEYFEAIAQEFESILSQFMRSSNSPAASFLTKPIFLHQEVKMITRHIFSAYTALRWFDLYF